MQESTWLVPYIYKFWTCPCSLIEEKKKKKKKKKGTKKILKKKLYLAIALWIFISMIPCPPLHAPYR